MPQSQKDSEKAVKYANIVDNTARVCLTTMLGNYVCGHIQLTLLNQKNYELSIAPRRIFPSHNGRNNIDVDMISLR